MSDNNISKQHIAVHPAQGLRGEITVPGDKSISHRAVIIGSISDGKTDVSGFLEGEDNINTLNAFRSMGVAIDGPVDGRIVIHGRGLDNLKEPGNVIDAGNSGTTTRLLAGLLSGQRFFSVITGDASLRRRPMKRVVEPLAAMGARIYGRGNNNLAPLAIIGTQLKHIDYKSSIASAQVKSAMLLAGLYADGITSFEEPEKSRDHTEIMLKAFGADITTDGGKISVHGRPFLKARKVNIPGDISSAAFFIAAALITKRSELLIKNVGINPTRTGIIDILNRMGAGIGILNPRESSGEHVADLLVKSAQLRGVEIGKEDVPRTIDEFPILCIAASMADGETVITGASELRVKESDRIATMSSELRKLGVSVEELPDGMVIHGSGGFKGGRVVSYGDHRVAMSMIVAGLISRGEITVEDIACIDTSFPGFITLLDGVRAG